MICPLTLMMQVCSNPSPDYWDKLTPAMQCKHDCACFDKERNLPCFQSANQSLKEIAKALSKTGVNVRVAK